MADEKRGDSWRQFHQANLTKKALSKRAKKAQAATLRHARKFLVSRWENIRSVRRHVATWIVVVGLLVAATALQLHWFQQSYTTTASTAGGTYAEGVVGPIETLNPLFASSSAELSARKLLFSSLYSYDDTGHLQSDLATSLTTSEKSTVYTVKLRKNVQWQDDTPLTAKDVAFTVGLIKNTAVRSVITGWQNIDVKVLDDTTVQFTLPTTYAAFPHALTFPIVPEHILGKVDPSSLRQSSFSEHPVGSGPFEFRLLQIVNADEGRKVVHLVASSSYYRGAPKLAHFQLHSYDSSTAIASALRTGEINATPDLPIDQIVSLDTKRFNTISRPISSGVYALFNTTSDILKDRTVRQALQAATDTNALRAQMKGSVQSLDLPFINGQLTGSTVPKRPAADAKQAAALLDKAGWLVGTDGVRAKDGKQLKLAITAPKGSEYEKALEVIAGQWRTLGVGVTTQLVDTSDATENVLQTVLQPRSFDVLIYTLAIGADPDVYAYWDSLQSSQRGLNFSNYSSVVADDALVSARSRVEPALRNAKYIAFAKQWLDDAPAVGLYQSNMYYASTKTTRTVNDTMTLISPVNRYSDILYWSVDTKPVYKTP